jgi:hypothetical protein
VTGWEEVKRSLAEGRSSPAVNGRLGERAPEEKEHEDTVSVLLLSSGRLGHRRKHEGHNCIYGSLERREAEQQRQERLSNSPVSPYIEQMHFDLDLFIWFCFRFRTTFYGGSVGIFDE